MKKEKNYYGDEIQTCAVCHKLLEKHRVSSRGTARCLSCRLDYAREYARKRFDKLKK